jgi:hypothetical protein
MAMRHFFLIKEKIDVSQMSSNNYSEIKALDFS